MCFLSTQLLSHVGFKIVSSYFPVFSTQTEHAHETWWMETHLVSMVKMNESFKGEDAPK